MAHRFEWPEDNRCFGCGVNPRGLRLKFELQKDGWAVAETSLHSDFQGFRNAAHGGIVFTLIDEASVWAAMLQREVIAPTYHISADIRKRVPLEQEILVRARILEQRHKIYFAQGEVLDPKEKVLAFGETRLMRPVETANE